METVIAEKTEAIVKLGLTNTRTKDYFDLLALSRNFAFTGSDLVSSLAATFRTRDTPIPADIPPGLTDGFATDEVSLRLRQRFRVRGRIETKNQAAREAWRRFLDRVWASSDSAQSASSWVVTIFPKDRA